MASLHKNYKISYVACCLDTQLGGVYLGVTYRGWGGSKSTQKSTFTDII